MLVVHCQMKLSSGYVVIMHNYTISKKLLTITSENHTIEIGNLTICMKRKANVERAAVLHIEIYNHVNYNLYWETRDN